jgi:gamma-glutamyl:cysteine ligase YbdK (ATP-grasp superfamily)
MERLQIQLTSEQAHRLRERARQQKMSTAAVVREAVDSALRDLSGGSSGGTRWQRSRAAVGRFGSGSPNRVSEDHDQHLEDIYRS